MKYIEPGNNVNNIQLRELRQRQKVRTEGTMVAQLELHCACLLHYVGLLDR